MGILDYLIPGYKAKRIAKAIEESDKEWAAFELRRKARQQAYELSWSTRNEADRKAHAVRSATPFPYHQTFEPKRSEEIKASRSEDNDSTDLALGLMTLSAASAYSEPASYTYTPTVDTTPSYSPAPACDSSYSPSSFSSSSCDSSPSSFSFDS